MRYIAVIQGLYFLLTGIWALVSIRTFQMVTGPKFDLWLVKTVGLLVSVIGVCLISAAVRNQISFEIFLLATGSAAALAMIDIVYVSKSVISPIYLLDALGELILICLWILSLLFSLAST